MEQFKMLRQLKTDYRSFKEKEIGVIHSEEINEIISLPTSRLVRWGGVIAMVLLLMIILISFITPYPETKSIEVKIVDSKVEYTLYSEPGNIERIFVKNGQLVEESQPLVSLESGHDLSEKKNVIFDKSSIIRSPKKGNVLFLPALDTDTKKEISQPLLSIRSEVKKPYGEFTYLATDRSYIKLKSIATIRFLNKDKKVVTRSGIVDSLYPTSVKGRIAGRIIFRPNFSADLKFNKLKVLEGEIVLNDLSIADKLKKVISDSNKTL